MVQQLQPLYVCWIAELILVIQGWPFGKHALLVLLLLHPGWQLKVEALDAPQALRARRTAMGQEWRVVWTACWLPGGS